MPLGEQRILEDAIEKAELEDRSLLIPCCHKGKNVSHNIEATATNDSERANGEIASRSSPVPETSEAENNRQWDVSESDGNERHCEHDGVSATKANDEILRGKPSISNVQKLNPIGTYRKIICQ